MVEKAKPKVAESELDKLGQQFDKFNDNDMFLSNLRKAASVLRVNTGMLIPK